MSDRNIPTDRKTPRWKQLVPHRKGCRALDHVDSGSWTTPWSYLKEVQYRDRIGRLSKNGSRWWWTRCNCLDCPGELVINETWLLERVTGGRVSRE